MGVEVMTMWPKLTLALLSFAVVSRSQKHDLDLSPEAKVKAGCDPDYGWIDGLAGSNKCYMALTYADSTGCYNSGDWAYGMTWFEAMQCCYFFGGYLAEVGSEEEQSLLVNHANLIGQHAYYWLGGTDLHHQGGFVWVSGRKFGYTAWAEGEPNEGGEGRKQRGLHRHGRWQELLVERRRLQPSFLLRLHTLRLLRENIHAINLNHAACNQALHALPLLRENTHAMNLWTFRKSSVGIIKIKISNK